MQALHKLLHEQKRTKKFVARYGTQFYCACYRDSQAQQKRSTTVELIVVESGRTPPPSRIAAESIIGVRAGWRETEVQSRIRQAGGGWNRSRELWEMRYDQAVALGLEDRIEEASISR